METASGIDEWLTFDEDRLPLTIHLHNGVVQSIHR
jgi:hypothetical protein